MKKNKTGLIIIIIAILCLVGGALYLFFGTDMFKKKEEPKEDKKEEEKETFELGKSELNGVYEKDGITIKLFEVAKNSVYFDYEVEGLGVSLPLKLRNGKATGDIFDDTYAVVIKDNEIELTSNSEEVEKGTYTKTKTYTKEDFYKDEAWVRLLFLKRQDYEYENEIRIVLVSKDEKESAAGINLEYQCDVKNLFPRVTLTPSPDISDEIRAEIITKLKKDFSYDDGEIIKNPLYESKEPRNINLDYRK